MSKRQMKRRTAAVRRVKWLLAATLLLTLWVTGAAQKKDSCLDCHAQMEGPLAEAAGLMQEDIHRSRGLSCVDCHGGDATLDDPAGAMSPFKGFIGRPKPRDIPAFCGKCHSNAERMKQFNPTLRVDQEQEYLTSVHGKLLQTGDQQVATCISCHGSHGVRAVTDPLSKVYPLNVAETCAACHANADYMKSYKIPHDQYAKYKTSVHARSLLERQDLSAPTCNDCHGNHGATPPGITSVANVCGGCHVRQSELFRGSVHKAIFDARQLSECAQCHRHHDIVQPDDEMIGVGERSVCVKCHSQGDRGYQAAEQIRGQMDTLAARIEKAFEILSKAERAGMDVSRSKFEMSQAKDALTHARVLVHSVSMAEVDQVISPGLQVADKGHQAGEAALDEWSFRRKGLGVSLFFILFLALLLYLKIRQIEGAKEPLP